MMPLISLLNFHVYRPSLNVYIDHDEMKRKKRKVVNTSEINRRGSNREDAAQQGELRKDLLSF